ncbi:MAG: DUF2332 domain-containing protein [Hyphomonadaceae bacterium]|nr:DUF2332 domain-containing protein [Hyphomonadaceae bacterium]
MDSRLSAHAQHFLKQAEWCARLGSPFNAALLRALAGHIGTGGILDHLLLAGETPLSPEAADAGPLRIAGALHAMALSERDAALAALYPAARPDWSMEAVVPAALSALARHRDWVASFILNTPQTNETRRSIALLPGFAALEGPLHLMEIGASAGLNQHWDAFGYDGGGWSREGIDGAPVITTDWHGPLPVLPDTFMVASRTGCDRSPLDVRDPDERVRLISYIWPDQADRLARVRAAIEIAKARGVSIDRADAADWLEQQLAAPLREGTSVIFHSIAWQYFDAETDRRARSAIETAGARADDRHRLAWLRFEHQKALGEAGQDHLVDLITWPGGHRRILAKADPHAMRVEML